MRSAQDLVKTPEREKSTSLDLSRFFKNIKGKIYATAGQIVCPVMAHFHGD